MIDLAPNVHHARAVFLYHTLHRRDPENIVGIPPQRRRELVRAVNVVTSAVNLEEKDLLSTAFGLKSGIRQSIPVTALEYGYSEEVVMAMQNRAMGKINADKDTVRVLRAYQPLFATSLAHTEFGAIFYRDLPFVTGDFDDLELPYNIRSILGLWTKNWGHGTSEPLIDLLTIDTSGWKGLKKYREELVDALDKRILTVQKPVLTSVLKTIASLPQKS